MCMCPFKTLGFGWFDSRLNGRNVILFYETTYRSVSELREVFPAITDGGFQIFNFMSIALRNFLFGYWRVHTHLQYKRVI